MVMSLVNLVIFIFFLVFHLRAKGVTECVTYTKVKTWMLLLIILMELIVFWLYMFQVKNGTIFDLMLIGTGYI